MVKNKKKEKQQPKFILFLVEGESDIIVLETPLAELIFDKYPDYEVRFLLQHKLVSQSGEEVESDDFESEDDYIIEAEYDTGGDITTSPFVVPENIEQKIASRFIQPAINSEGIYPKRIAKIIQITDLDGAFIPQDSIKGFQSEREGRKKPFYNTDEMVIETDNVEGIMARNERKSNNIDYLLSLTNRGIKIKQKTIPYEIYFFSSNLDHFINHNANIESGKKRLANQFLRTYGLKSQSFCNYFSKDEGAVGKLGYKESWNMVREENYSLGRYTNIDYLIQKLLERQ